MFGKRSNTAGELRKESAPAAAAPEPAAAPVPGPAVEGGRAAFPSVGLAAPLVNAPAAPTRDAGPAAAPPSAVDSRHSEVYYEVKGTIFGALIEAIDLAQLARLDADAAREEIRDIVNEIIAIKNVAMSISEQEELLDDICNDVLGYGPLEPLLARDDIADIMVNGSGTDLYRGRRQDPADRDPLSRQPATAQHLPAHRQPGRPPGRRILADLRRAPSRRFPRQCHRGAAGDRWPCTHHPKIQEGQAHARAVGPIRHDLAGRRGHPESDRPLPGQYRRLRRHRIGQDHDAQLRHPLHRRRRTHHHLRGRRRAAVAATARGSAGDQGRRTWKGKAR